MEHHSIISFTQLMYTIIIIPPRTRTYLSFSLLVDTNLRFRSNPWLDYIVAGSAPSFRHNPTGRLTRSRHVSSSSFSVCN